MTFHPPVRSRLLAAAALLAVTAMGGCAAPGGAARADGVLTFSTGQQPDCLDPQVSPAGITALINRNVFDSLVEMTPDGRFEPWLARSWTIAPDGLAYTFQLRDDVKFHDGTPVNAAAVKATLDHAVDPKTKSFSAKNLISGYAGAEVTGEDVVTVRLSKPNSALMQALSTPNLGIQSPRSIEGNFANLCWAPVGSGPFSFVRWARNERISLTRNPAYAWGPPSAKHTGAAALNGIDFVFMSEAKVRFGALTSGQVDVSEAVEPANAKSLAADGTWQYFHNVEPGMVHYLLFNSTKGKLADERVRTALMRSADLDALVRTATFGQLDRAWSPLSPTTIHYDLSTVGSWQVDRDLAGRLLDEAGWTGRDEDGYRTKNGERLTISWPYNNATATHLVETLAQGIQAEAKKAGIEIVRQGRDLGTWTNDLLNGNMDMFNSSYSRNEPDVLRFFFATGSTAASGGANLFKINHPELDAWLVHANTTVDEKARADDYAKAQRYLIEHSLVMPIYVPAKLMGASPDVHGLRFDVSGSPLFYDVSLAGARS
ncbi:ABC transporter substrate-binding protein [Lentzea sp.]|uniref:ABC transporter substrate-binding protein n=1 Tax=Lentzea sp. TaxID=56099 RepID=UPI002ED193D9